MLIILNQAQVQARAHLAKTLAMLASRRYSVSVPDKEGNRLGRLKRKKRTHRAMRFFYVRMLLRVSYGRQWQGSLRACWFFFFHQSTNPAICRSPRLVAGRGVTAKKEAPMPSCTRTPEQFPSVSIANLAGQANAVTALLSVIDIIPGADRAATLATCAQIARDISLALDGLVGGAA